MRKAGIFIDSNLNTGVDTLETLGNAFTQAAYLPSEEIVTLSQLAIKLNKPILVEGPPGVGKTALAKALSTITQGELYRIQCYEGITAEQVIGEFNYQRQLLAIEASKAAKAAETTNSMNSAISDVFTPDFFIARPLLKAIQSTEPVVLLIDEIDRADEEFEAFLLEALAENQITIPELGTIEGNGTPLVILTSNATRSLSGALRRRSLFLALDYPVPSREREIIKMHVPGLEDTIYEKIVKLLHRIRNNDDISQPPSISEGIELASTLLILGSEYLEADKIEEVLGLIVKSQADITAVRQMLRK